MKGPETMSKLFTRTVGPVKDAPAELTILMLHGLGSNEDDLLGLAGPLNLPVRLIAARAPIPMLFGLGNGYAWYEFDSGGHPVLARFEYGLNGLITLVQDVRERLHVPAHKLIILGFSQGAVMTMALALSIPDQIGGIVALSGYFPKPEGWQQPSGDVTGLPVLITHGVNDRVVPVQGSRGAADKFRDLGADVQYNEFRMGHEVSPDCVASVRHWLMERIEQA